MLGSHGLGAIIEVWRLATKLHDGCVCVVHWPAVLGSRLRQIPEGRDKISLLISQSAMATVVTAVHHMFYRSRMYNETYLCTMLIITVTKLTYNISRDELMKK